MKFLQKQPKGEKFSAMNVSFDSRGGDAEPPTSVSTKPTPTLDLTASKTFQEEDEEPEVEVDISRSGEPFIFNEGAKPDESQPEETPNRSRWHFFQGSKSTSSSPGSGRKLPAAMPGWTKDLPTKFQGWSRRERILLVIAVVNMLIVFGLLGSNMRLVRQSRNQSVVSAASRNEEPNEGDNGGKGGKGEGKGKKSSKGSDSSYENAEGEGESNSNSDGSTGEWTISTDTSNAGGSGNSNTPPDSTPDSSPASAPPPPTNSNPVARPNPTPAIPNSGGTTPSASSTSGQGTSTAVVLGDSSFKCGCAQCTTAVWNELAGPYTCGDRISFLQNEFPMRYPSQVHACRQIAFEHPGSCGGCDPGRCSIGTPEFFLPGNWKPPTKDRFGVVVTPAPTPVTAATSTADQQNLALYCFPNPEARTTYTMWGGMIVQPKEDAGVCGPGNNRFTSANVIVNEGAGTLTLVNTGGTSSEVRILLPAESRPYTYGTYSFSVRSVEVKDAAGAVLSNVLPKELILGLFTWDDTENYAVHENYNHEVDIEISRWNVEQNSDLQYLVQPPGFPQMHRLFSGDASGSAEEKYKQGGQVYEFTWNPGRIDWESTAGNAGNNKFSLKSEEAVYRGVVDHVQCMPDRGGNTEVRINLWNFLGAVPPVGLSSAARVEVVIDNFSFVPSGRTHVPDGGVCSRHCHCDLGVSQCIHNVCTQL